MSPIESNPLEPEEVEPDAIEAPPVLTPRQRRALVELPADPTDEELALHWTVSEADKDHIYRCRGDDARLWCAVQLCVLRKTGRFLATEAIPSPILGYMCRQLGLELVLFVTPPHRDTQVEQERRLRDYLGFRHYDAQVQEKLERWLWSRAGHHPAGAELFERAQETLRAWRVVLPAPSTLERLVASVAARAQQTVFNDIIQRVPPWLRETIDGLLSVAEGEHRSILFHLQEYPEEPTASDLTYFLEKCHELLAQGVDGMDWKGVRVDTIHHLAELARRYDVWSLRRFGVKRYALVACLLLETQKTLLDQIVGMHETYLKAMQRKARIAAQQQQGKARRRVRRGMDTLIEVGELLLQGTAGEDILCRLGSAKVQEAVAACSALRRLEERGYLEKLSNRYSHLRQYLPAFFRLPFQARPGAGPLQTAVELVRRLDSGEQKTLPADAPIDFVPAGWRDELLAEDGALDRRVWELALADAVREGLRSGDLFLPQSGRHVSFSNLIYNDQQWAEDRDTAYLELSLPSAPDGVLDRLRREYDEVADRTERGLPRNEFAAVCEGRLRLKKTDALPLSERVEQLRRLLASHYPQVRIERLLEDVDLMCGFTRAFNPLPGYPSRTQPLYGALLAALVAQGTNLGLMAMGQSAEGITPEMLQHVMQWFIREETIKAANTIMVNFHHRHPLSRVWGLGTLSSSDGQRFGVQGSSLMASLYPRYFGYYDRAVTFYTHVADQFSVFSTRIISCQVREALYVLEGLLENDTILQPREHTTDTHGCTEHLFGLCYLLGYSFMPRLADLKDRQLYKMTKERTYGRLDPLLKPCPDVELIDEQWDELARVAASLKNRTAPASVVLRRLMSSPNDRLSRALLALGRLVKTIHILRYIHDPEIRQRIQMQLNRGEHRHQLGPYVFFANRGEIRSGDYVEIMNKATSLSLLSNAILVWNTAHLDRMVERLRHAGEEVLDEDLAHISPLAHKHLIIHGTYSFDRGKSLVVAGWKPGG